MAIGALWYSPALFLKPWQKLAGVSDAQMKQGMVRALAVDFAGSLVMAVILAHAIRFADAGTVGRALCVGFLGWLGFVAATNISSVTYERRPFALWLIQNGFQFAAILVMSAVLAYWS